MRRAPILLAALALLLVAAAPARADFGFKELGLGLSGTQAGAHPESVTNVVQMNTELNESLNLEFPEGQLQNLEVDMPPGFAGNPTAVPRCSLVVFTVAEDGISKCPNSSVVGIVAAKAEFDPIEPGAPAYFHVPLFNLEPSPGFAAKLGFIVIGIPITIDVGVREEAPYGVYARITNTSQTARFYGSKVTLWGVPADPSHDPYRGSCLEVLTAGEIDELISNGKCSAGILAEPFLTSPRSCEGPLTASFLAIPWNTGLAVPGSASAPARTGCSKVGFEAQAQAELSTTRAESPSGLSFELNIDDESLVDPSYDAVALSDIKSAKVTLPQGVTLNPSQAQGLAACTEADLDRETASSPFGAGCPAASKVGTVEVETPLLEDRVLKGSLFVAQPYENPFGSLVAIYMVVKDEDLGIAVKLPARVQTDPVSGRVTTTFGDPSAKDPLLRTLPQLPLGSVRVNLRSGDRSPLVTPPACGTYEIDSLFTPWANPGSPYPISTSFQINSGPGGGPCPSGLKPFSPSFAAGTTNPAAGAYSPFSMRLTRSDNEAELTRFSTVLPPGLVGKIAGLGRCPEAAIAAAATRTGKQELAAPSCPDSSKVGRTLAGAGVGPELTYVPGSLYLAGPFAGAPLSVVAITPAVAGPFDLGTVVVRVALNLNPITAQVEVDGSASQPIPTILQGIPLKLRDLRIYADRPEFTLNPTSCAEKQIQATALAGGLAANLAQRFQAASCASLAFAPKLKLTLKGQVKRSGNPALRSVLTARPGDANIGSATVLLPPSQFIDNAHINNPCTRAQFDANACPPKSVLGTARAYSPLLDEPLEGPVYFRSNGGARELPDVVADLHGLFRVILVGFVDSRNGRVRTRFLEVPDAPVSRFELNLYGGKRGLLENSKNLCKADLHTRLTLIGQNGRRSETNPVMATSCKKKGRVK